MKLNLVETQVFNWKSMNLILLVIPRHFLKGQLFLDFGLKVGVSSSPFFCEQQSTEVRIIILTRASSSVRTQGNIPLNTSYLDRPFTILRLIRFLVLNIALLFVLAFYWK